MFKSEAKVSSLGGLFVGPRIRNREGSVLEVKSFKKAQLILSSTV